jgi:hypothetical protein
MEMSEVWQSSFSVSGWMPLVRSKTKDGLVSAYAKGLEANIDYDGDVDYDDFIILAWNYGPTDS